MSEMKRRSIHVPLPAVGMVTTLGALSLIAWVGVATTSMPMAGLLDPFALVLFTSIWSVGMVAMMLPSLSPMVYVMVLSARKSLEDQGTSIVSGKIIVFARAAFFILGYVMVWTLVGVIFYIAIGGLALAGFSVSFSSLGLWAGLVLVAVGLYQFTRFKQEALMKCRSPMSFMMTRWRNRTLGSSVMGADYGLFCTRCCWVLMAGLLTVGAMSLPLMGLFSIIIFAEKIGPFGALVSRLVGFAFLAVGIALVL